MVPPNGSFAIDPLATEFRVDLFCSAVCRSREYPGIGGEGKRNLSQLIHP